MAYQQILGEDIGKLGERALKNPKIREGLVKYDGRTLVLKVQEDAVYVFHISKDGVSLEVNPPSYPYDMYAEMNIERADKMIRKGKVNPLDVVRKKIKHKNISMSDIDFIKEILASE